MTVRKLLRFVFTACMLFVACGAYADTTFIRFGSVWKYYDKGDDPGTSWKNVSAPETESWANGAAKLGYGNGDERTLINFGGNRARKYITTYFRTSFTIPDISTFTFFRIKAYVDDGMAVYINGKEVCRTSMGGGVISNNTLASRETPDNGNITMPFNIPAEKFVNGVNNLAVEVHQGSLDSDDLTFDLELAGITKDTATEITRGPLLQMVSEEGITISWRTNESTPSTILYGISEDSMKPVTKEGAKSTDHTVRITGLKPDTKYYYAIANGTDILQGSYRNYFITAPPANTTRKIRIGVFGDAGTGNRHQKTGRDRYLQLFKKENSGELAILLGDNAYNTGTDHEYQTNFFDVYDDNVLNNHVVFPIPGNHEYYSPGVPYYSVFSLPTAAESGGVPSGTESYYSFNYGNIHFVMLNSMGHDNGTLLRDSTGDQAKWLKKDLEANVGKHKWTIACLHHPPYSNGTHNSDGETELIGLRQQITPILERYGVDAVLAGHSHVYERSFLIQGHTGRSNTFKALPPADGNLVSSSSARYDGTVNSCPYFTVDTVEKKGTVYIVAGSAGQIGGGTNAGLPLFYYKNYSGTTGGESGVLYLEVQDNRLDAKFIGLSGTVRDQFTIMKGVNSKKIINTEINKSIDLTASWVGSYNWTPEPEPGKDGLRTLTIKPTRADTYTYFVRDSVGPSKTCISDTFEIQVSSPVLSTLKFEARQKYNAVLVKWSIEKQADLDYFTLERSANGMDYTMLTVIKPTVLSNSGNSPFIAAALTNTADYEFEDNYPVQGNNYYRLKKTLKNAQTTSLGQRLVAFEKVKSFTYSVKSPSLGKNMIAINVESSKKQLLQIKMFDMSGKMIYRNNLVVSQGNNDINIMLTPGMYVLNILAPDNTRVSDKILFK